MNAVDFFRFKGFPPFLPSDIQPLDTLTNNRIYTDYQPGGDYFVLFPQAGAAVTLTNRPAGEVGMLTAIQMSVDGAQGSFDARLRVYVDQETYPSIDIDLGTLFVSHLDAHTGAGNSMATDNMQRVVVGTNTQFGGGGSNTQASYQMQYPVPYSNGVKVEVYTPAGVTVPASGTFLFTMVHYRLGVPSE